MKQLSKKELQIIFGGFTYSYAWLAKILRRLGLCDPIHGCGGPSQTN